MIAATVAVAAASSCACLGHTENSVDVVRSPSSIKIITHYPLLHLLSLACSSSSSLARYALICEVEPRWPKKGTRKQIVNTAEEKKK